MEGGEIALVEDGDIILIDSIHNTIEAKVSEEEFNARRAKWKKPDYKVKSGYLWKYIKNVENASGGCLTDR